MLVTTPNHMINVTQVLSFPRAWALFQAQAARGGEPPWAAAAGSSQTRSPQHTWPENHFHHPPVKLPCPSHRWRLVAFHSYGDFHTQLTRWEYLPPPWLQATQNTVITQEAWEKGLFWDSKQLSDYFCIYRTYLSRDNSALNTKNHAIL